MRVSASTIEVLTQIITGDKERFPYRTGPQLVDFFNDFGAGDFYHSGFPARTAYAKEKLNALNGTDAMSRAIQEALDPVHYSEEMPANEAAAHLNKHLVKDGYRIVQDERPNSSMSMDYAGDIEIAVGMGDLPGYPDGFHEKFYRVQPLGQNVVDIKADVRLSHDFITEQVSKAKEKLAKNDYDGAITNARSLVEAIQEEIIRKSGMEVPKHDGDLLKLYKTTKQVLNLDPSQKDLSDTLKQILTGLTSLVSGIAGLSNKMADRHARTYRPDRHHAKLAVNTAFTFCEFLLDSFEYQQDKRDKKAV